MHICFWMSVQAKGAERLGCVKWILHWISLQRDLICTNGCGSVPGDFGSHASEVRTQTHTQVHILGCLHPPSHTSLRQRAHSEFSSPSHQGRETPFIQCVEIQTNQSPWDTRLIRAQTPAELRLARRLSPGSTSLSGSEMYGQIQWGGWAYTRNLPWRSSARSILIVGKMQDKRFVSEVRGLRVQPEMGVFSSPHTRTGNTIISAVKQQDYSAMIWLKRRDKMERVSLSADIDSNCCLLPFSPQQRWHPPVTLNAQHTQAPECSVV